MRILHVTEALGGGIQSAIANYIDGLPDVEHAVYSRARDGQQTHSWPDTVEHEQYDGGLPGFFLRLRAKVRDEKPTVVHLHSSFAGAARGILPAGTAMVYSPHCYAMERQDVVAPVRWIFATVEFLLARRRQSTVAVSPREAEIAERLNPNSPTVLVLNPSPLGDEPPAERAGDEVVMVGRILPQKDPEFFAAVARASADGPGRFVWIGDGDQEERATLRESGVEVTGWVPPSELRGRLRRAALCLHTAAWEGGPVSAVEAAALGVPVLARDIPAMRSLGYAVVPGPPERLAAEVRHFFTDPDFARRIARSSQAVVEASSRPAMAEGLRSAYAKAIVRTSRGRPRAR